MLLIISFENSLFVFDLCYYRILILTKVMISHPKTPLVYKKGMTKKSRIIPGSEYISRLAKTRSDIRMQSRLSILNASTTLNTL